MTLVVNTPAAAAGASATMSARSAFGPLARIPENIPASCKEQVCQLCTKVSVDSQLPDPARLALAVQFWPCGMRGSAIVHGMPLQVLALRAEAFGRAHAAVDLLPGAAGDQNRRRRDAECHVCVAAERVCHMPRRPRRCLHGSQTCCVNCDPPTGLAQIRMPAQGVRHVFSVAMRQH